MQKATLHKVRTCEPSTDTAQPPHPHASLRLRSCPRDPGSAGRNQSPDVVLVAVRATTTQRRSEWPLWVLSALSILKMEWINPDKLIAFILSAQDPELGRIADRPGDMADVFHTQFGVAGRDDVLHLFVQSVVLNVCLR